MKKTAKRIKKLFLEFIPLFVKTGLLHSMPFLYDFLEIQPNSSVVLITDRCNLKCIMCNQWREPAKKELSTEDWRKIITDLRKNGIRNMHFTGGEPLLREDLPELIAYATSCGIVSGVMTNAFILEKEKLERLILSGVSSIGVSVDALSDAYEKIRGVQGSFRRLEKSLSLLAEAKKKNNMSVYINFTLMKSNVGEFVKVKKAADLLGIPVGVCLLDKHSYIFDLEENRNKFWLDREEDFVRLANLISFLEKEKEEKPSTLILNFSMLDYIMKYFKDPRQADIPCVSSQARIVIDPYGNLLGGCMSMGSFGNLAEKPFRELKNEQKYKRSKKNMFYKKCPGCSCGYQFNVLHTPGQAVKDVFKRISGCLKKNSR